MPPSGNHIAHRGLIHIVGVPDHEPVGLSPTTKLQDAFSVSSGWADGAWVPVTCYSLPGSSTIIDLSLVEDAWRSERTYVVLLGDWSLAFLGKRVIRHSLPGWSIGFILEPVDRALTEIQLKALSAVVAWVSPDCKTTFDIHFDTASKATFLGLRAAVAVIGNALQEETPLYLHIAPDRIASLAYNGPNKTPENMRQELGTTMIRLQFGMSKPADLIGPSGSSWKPRKRKDSAVLDSLERLAHATSFSVYHEYQDSLSDTLLQALTAGVADKSLVLLEREYEIPTLYAGSGGQLLVTAPPLYDTSEAPPPGGASSSRSSKKRPRHDSSEPEDGGSQTVEDICRKLVPGAIAQLSRESTQLGKKLQLLRAEVSASQQTRTDTAEELQRMRTEMKTELTKHMEEQVVAIAEDPQTLLHATIESRRGTLK
ncbi:hypothetical protein VM1G_08155 [Cytospora mali]|uniref:Uncharacterized protein n=1 Tax=Cytospora mali TaxID=578113 RepID=A0A194W951_CYTMA|nr:hypothetical protein VM1G_08155 [Valsa mali]